MKKGYLSGNQLKIIALIAMTCDHVGVQLFPDLLLLRIIGRLAMPIYAYMIAEGCRHTRNMGKYLGTMLAFAALCQGVYFFAMGSLYMSILVTFSLAIGLIFLIQQAKDGFAAAVPALLAGIAAVYVLTLPGLLPGTDFAIDYGFFGVMLPVLIYLGRNKWESLLLCALGLTALALTYGGIQWYGLAALPLLALYSGKRGKYKMKYLFYIYYPAHLAAIYAISLLI
jgi:hypothetical protein